MLDVIIPTYKPDGRFIEALEMLNKQTMSVKDIIIINTDKSIWDSLSMDEQIAKLNLKPGLKLRHIAKEEFDHGASRNLGVSLSESEYFACMTQDALPKDEYLTQNLLKYMSDEIKLCYARQEAYADADEIEKFTRDFNYPKEDIIKSEADRDRLGIKTYFSSNVCAAYERANFEKLGGFKEGLILNEDMVYAAMLLKSGKKSAYVSEAVVYHSHNYTGKQQFNRNFDIAVSQVESSEYFEGLKSECEGIRLVKLTLIHLLKKGSLLSCIKLIYISTCKYLGYRMGKRYKKLSKSKRISYSMNKSYWEKSDAQ